MQRKKDTRNDATTSIIGQVKSFVYERSYIHVYVTHEGAMSSIDRRCILRPLSDAAPPYFCPTRNTRPPDNVCRSRKVMEGNSAGWSTTSCEIGGRFNKHRVVPLVILSRISRGMHRAGTRKSRCARRDREVSFGPAYIISPISLQPLTIIALGAFMNIIVQECEIYCVRNITWVHLRSIQREPSSGFI